MTNMHRLKFSLQGNIFTHMNKTQTIFINNGHAHVGKTNSKQMKFHLRRVTSNTGIVHYAYNVMQ